MHGKINDALIWYLYHSGFAVKTLNHYLIFDYYLDNPGEEKRFRGDGVLNLPEMENPDTIIFASHGHSDHFNPAILKWKEKLNNIEYVMSHDIKAGKNREDVTVVHPGNNYFLKGVNIEVLGSTDIGVSFMVNCDGIAIFHAGDLNWWHWKGEPEDENNAMAENYKKQIDLLRGKQVDIAFIPVDWRLEEYYILGLDYFMTAVGAKMVFPMHFGKDYSVFKWLKKEPRAEGYINRIAEITPLNRKFVYSTKGK